MKSWPISRLASLVLGVMLLGAAAYSHAASPSALCPAPGHPHSARLLWVAPHIGMDGLPMAILELRTAMAPAQILAWYLKHWASLRPAWRPIRYAEGGWQVVARRKAGCFETVQVQATAGGSLGYIGVSRLAGVKPPVAMTPLDGVLPVPAGARDLLEMESHDAGRRASTTLLQVGLAPAEAVRYFRDALVHQGWAVQMDRSPVAGGGALMFQRKNRQIELGISTCGAQTCVLATLVRS